MVVEGLFLTNRATWLPYARSASALPPRRIGRARTRQASAITFCRVWALKANVARGISHDRRVERSVQRMTTTWETQVRHGSLDRWKCTLQRSGRRGATLHDVHPSIRRAEHRR